MKVNSVNKKLFYVCFLFEKRQQLCLYHMSCLHSLVFCLLLLPSNSCLTSEPAMLISLQPVAFTQTFLAQRNVSDNQEPQLLQYYFICQMHIILHSDHFVWWQTVERWPSSWTKTGSYAMLQTGLIFVKQMCSIPVPSISTVQRHLLFHSSNMAQILFQMTMMMRIQCRCWMIWRWLMMTVNM